MKAFKMFISQSTCFLPVTEQLNNFEGLNTRMP